MLDPSTTQYFLGGKDEIVDAVRVKEYLENHGVAVGVNLNWADAGGHGKALKGASLLSILNFAGGISEVRQSM